MQDIRYVPNVQLMYDIMNCCVWITSRLTAQPCQNEIRSRIYCVALKGSILIWQTYASYCYSFVWGLKFLNWDFWDLPFTESLLQLFAKYIWLSWIHNDSIELIRIPGEQQWKIYCLDFGPVLLPQNTCWILNNGIVRCRVQSVEQ